MLEVIANIFLAVGAIAASGYCHVLAERLNRFNALESGMGGAIAVLSAQVDEMTAALAQARTAASGSADDLAALVARSEAAAARLDLLLASMHDLPDPSSGDELHRRVRFARRRRPEVEDAA